MKWVLIASALVAAAFVGTFSYTGDTWAATNAAGIVSLIYLLIFLYRVARPPLPAKWRWWTRGIGLVTIAGTTFFWAGMYSTTTWQVETLHTIHKVIFHGVSMDLLRTKGMKILSTYATQNEANKLSIGEIFRKETTLANPDSSIIEIAGDNRYRLFAEAVTDTHVVIVCQSIIRIDGELTTFKNFDGRTGMTQDRVVVTKRGVAYEIQN
ncbi:MAG: hypothetical protein A2X66_07810 [Ignavibacteria bacterium GWA2_54_16]|nr:MAG: hypothetical protein A2X66_07810 [Ignavibacteria bacterium GWA2_54_16]